MIAVDDTRLVVAAPGGQIEISQVYADGGREIAAWAFAKSPGLQRGARPGS